MIALYIVAGFALLLLGGEFLVNGSVALARRLSVSPFLIGLTVVAYGTSAPELVISMDAAVRDAPELAVGNIVGSNIANILVVLGSAALFSAVKCDRRLLAREIPVLALATILFVAFSMNLTIVLWHGVVLLSVLVGFTAYSYAYERRHHTVSKELWEKEEAEVTLVPRALWLTIVFMAGGLAAIIIGAELLIEGSVDMARRLGVSESVIGLTLLALGSSLPELATTIVAAYRKHADIALGNVLGSCIFNILGVVGLVALVLPLPIAAEIRRFDMWVMAGVLTLPMLLALTGVRLGRLGGMLCMAAYGGYIYLQYEGV
ncbi:MAG: calcium/sodium antiporter [Alphaproteobacteria bacterium]